MKQSIDAGFDDHPPDDDRRRGAWAVAIADDCDGCDDQRVELTVEEEGAAGGGLVLHLSPDTARRLRAAIAAGLRDLGERPGT